MTNTEQNELHKQTVTATTEADMLQLLRRLLRGAVTFCAFETIREPTTADKMRREQLSVCEN
jgi:hypothetical protein